MALPQEPGQPRPKFPNENTRLTHEETVVLKECEKESFFRRALPLSCGAILGVQYLIRTGKLTTHRSYGSLPKSVIAAGIAFLAGKVSYLPECRKKILEQIPDSNLAMQIKNGQSATRPDMSNRQNFSTKTPAAGDENKDTGLTYPADQRTYEGLNDSQRPSMDNEVKPQDPPEVEPPPMTYEDMRQRNRDGYTKRTGKAAPDPSYKDSPFMPQKPWPADKKPSSSSEPPSNEDPSQQAPPKRKRTNMWGDVIEE